MVAGGSGIGIDDRGDHRGGDRGGVHRRVGVVAADQGVAASTTTEGVRSGSRNDGVIARSAREVVGPSIADEVVGATGAADRVSAGAGEHDGGLSGNRGVAGGGQIEADRRAGRQVLQVEVGTNVVEGVVGHPGHRHVDGIAADGDAGAVVLEGVA